MNGPIIYKTTTIILHPNRVLYPLAQVQVLVLLPLTYQHTTLDQKKQHTTTILEKKNVNSNLPPKNLK